MILDVTAIILVILLVISLCVFLCNLMYDILSINALTNLEVFIIIITIGIFLVFSIDFVKGYNDLYDKASKIISQEKEEEGKEKDCKFEEKDYKKLYEEELKRKEEELKRKEENKKYKELYENLINDKK